MKNATEMGINRTGIALSPIDKRLLMDGADGTVPSMEGDEGLIDETRVEYIAEGASIGTVPPPATVKGAAGAVLDVAKGTDINVLVDKLGERLAFERTGTRLYGALLAKFDASARLPGGPRREELEKIYREEAAHFEMLVGAMLSIGADPTAITPSADVAAVTSNGLIQVLGDPRMNLKQSLEAMLVAELVDNDAWSGLIELARAGGHRALVQRFEQALVDEEEHLVNVRQWVRNASIADVAPRKAP